MQTKREVYIHMRTFEVLKEKARKAAEEDGRTLAGWVEKAISEKLERDKKGGKR